MDELDEFHERIRAALLELSVLSRRTQIPDVVLAVACEAFALAVRMTARPEVIKLIDTEYALSLMKFSKLLLKPRKKPAPDPETKAGSPTGAKLISDALAQPPIPDDKKH